MSPLVFLFLNLIYPFLLLQFAFSTLPSIQSENIYLKYFSTTLKHKHTRLLKPPHWWWSFGFSVACGSSYWTKENKGKAIEKIQLDYQKWWRKYWATPVTQLPLSSSSSSSSPSSVRGQSVPSFNHILNQWANPQYNPPPFQLILSTYRSSSAVRDAFCPHIGCGRTESELGNL